ncbi:GDP-mannose 4,6-dehydratase [Roseivirga sp.]|uniref:GDP-mannose 4,6-dehydratase n=1 Tax=Roseivirga sp. TaxID=1964215 RepID=UPI003B51ADBF
MKKALITGVTGQDGSYLAEFLLEKGYKVYGLIRKSSGTNQERISNLQDRSLAISQNFSLHLSDLTDSLSMMRIVEEVVPDEIYNLAAQSDVRISFETPEYTANGDALRALRLLESLRLSGLSDVTRFYQASSSEMFGKAVEVPQTEKTAFYPRNPYGIAKLYAHWITINYREAYNMHASCGILFNHESPRRGLTFVSRKVTRGVAAIKLGLQECLFIGNLDAERDWGHAKDYIRGMWQMLQQDQPDDYVLATGKKHSVREMITTAFAVFDEQVIWRGKGLGEIGVLVSSGKTVVRVDPKYFRPAEAESLIGDATKAKRKLDWNITISFSQMIEEMVLSDFYQLNKIETSIKTGFRDN